MGQNFMWADREQGWLMPPDVRDWLPEGHLAWFVLDAVDQLDLDAFYAAYGPAGAGRAAYDPAVMVALVVYAYSVGERSSRLIERRCIENADFRVITANQAPDHSTIARFRAGHEDALGALFGQVLGLCEKAGLVRVGTVALDGTKIAANASIKANRSYEQIARRILQEAGAVDAQEDAEHGDRRGDELPEELTDRSSRRARLREAKRQLDAEHEAKQDAHREHLAARAEKEQRLGHKLNGRKPKPPPAAVDPDARANVTDPDSRIVKSAKGFIQGYNAQALATTDQVIIAADVFTQSPDGGLLAPMLDQAATELAAVGIDADQHIKTVLADAGYFNTEQIITAMANGKTMLVPPDSRRDMDVAPVNGRQLRDEGLIGFMRTILRRDDIRALYKQRAATIEPVFGQIKHNRGAARFQRRGHTAARSEFRLLAATHNLRKLHTASLQPG
jgi:transposase